MNIENQIISILSKDSGLSSKEVHERLASDNIYSTTKRTLAKLVDKKLVDRSGNKRSSAYSVGRSYQILHSIDSEAYFETVDSIDYKKAMLIFYEQNNITAFKRIFMDQFQFAVRTYF